MKKLGKIFAVAMVLAMVLAMLPTGAAAAAETVPQCNFAAHVKIFFRNSLS